MGIIKVCDYVTKRLQFINKYFRKTERVYVKLCNYNVAIRRLVYENASILNPFSTSTVHDRNFLNYALLQCSQHLSFFASRLTSVLDMKMGGCQCNYSIPLHFLCSLSRLFKIKDSYWQSLDKPALHVQNHLKQLSNIIKNG